jgi:hypothetical protein
MIRLTTEVETRQGPMGATSCQMRFRGGRAVTVFGGNSLSSDAADRRGPYEAFVTELHRRLGPGDLRAHPLYRWIWWRPVRLSGGCVGVAPAQDPGLLAGAEVIAGAGFSVR